MFKNFSRVLLISKILLGIYAITLFISGSEVYYINEDSLFVKDYYDLEHDIKKRYEAEKICKDYMLWRENRFN